MRKKRSRKKRIGTSRLATAVALILAAWLPLAAAPKKQPALETYAIVSGSVFRDNGYALPGAGVVLAADTGKSQKMDAVSDARGEFVVRVPPGPVRYIVTVEATGYQSQRKTVNIEGQERVEVTFQLERESK